MLVFIVARFFSLHAIVFNPPVRVTGRFKVKAYASLHDDLYLQEKAACEAGYVTVLSLPPQKKTTGEHKRLRSQNKTKRPDKLLLEVRSERGEPTQSVFFVVVVVLALAALQRLSPP